MRLYTGCRGKTSQERGIDCGEILIARAPTRPVAQADKGPRVNEDIKIDPIRLIDHDGAMVGVVSLREGLERAEEAGLDLVEVSPDASPPVCKLLDYGKYRYRDQRKAREAKKRQRTFEVKEVKIRPNIDEHDYDVKMRSVTRFLNEGNKVKVTLRFRGREMAHQNLGTKVLNRVREELGERIKVEQNPLLEGRQMVMVVAPAQGLGQQRSDDGEPVETSAIVAVAAPVKATPNSAPDSELESEIKSEPEIELSIASESEEPVSEPAE